MTIFCSRIEDTHTRTAIGSLSYAEISRINATLSTRFLNLNSHSIFQHFILEMSREFIYNRCLCKNKTVLHTYFTQVKNRWLPNNDFEDMK